VLEVIDLIFSTARLALSHRGIIGSGLDAVVLVDVDEVHGTYDCR
jgi:hypothetical protein